MDLEDLKYLFKLKKWRITHTPCLPEFQNILSDLINCFPKSGSHVQWEGTCLFYASEYLRVALLKATMEESFTASWKDRHTFIHPKKVRFDFFVKSIRVKRRADPIIDMHFRQKFKEVIHHGCPLVFVGVVNLGNCSGLCSGLRILKGTGVQSKRA